MAETRTITGPVLGPDGTALASAKVEFWLSGLETGSESGSVYTESRKSVTTDASGEFSVSLACTDKLTRGQTYNIRITKSTGAVFKTIQAALPYGDGTSLKLGEWIELGAPATPAQSATIAAAEAAAASASAAASSATSAAGAATTAAASATSASGTASAAAASADTARTNLIAANAATKVAASKSALDALQPQSSGVIGLDLATGDYYQSNGSSWGASLGRVGTIPQVVVSRYGGASPAAKLKAALAANTGAAEFLLDATTYDLSGDTSGLTLRTGQTLKGVNREGTIITAPSNGADCITITGKHARVADLTIALPASPTSGTEDAPLAGVRVLSDSISGNGYYASLERLRFTGGKEGAHQWCVVLSDPEHVYLSDVYAHYVMCSGLLVFMPDGAYNFGDGQIDHFHGYTWGAGETGVEFRGANTVSNHAGTLNSYFVGRLAMSCQSATRPVSPTAPTGRGLVFTNAQRIHVAFANFEDFYRPLYLRGGMNGGQGTSDILISGGYFSVGTSGSTIAAEVDATHSTVSRVTLGAVRLAQGVLDPAASAVGGTAAITFQSTYLEGTGLNRQRVTAHHLELSDLGRGALAIPVKNASGGTISTGLLARVDASNDYAVTTLTTTDTAWSGVPLESITNGEMGRLAVAGVVTVFNDNAVTRGDTLIISAFNAGHVRSIGTDQTAAGTRVGIALASAAQWAGVPVLLVPPARPITYSAGDGLALSAQAFSALKRDTSVQAIASFPTLDWASHKEAVTWWKLQGNTAVRTLDDVNLTGAVSGQVLVLEGADDTNYVNVQSGTRLTLRDANVYALKSGCVIAFVADTLAGKWYELFRSHATFAYSNSGRTTTRAGIMVPSDGINNTDAAGTMRVVAASSPTVAAAGGLSAPSWELVTVALVSAAGAVTLSDGVTAGAMIGAGKFVGQQFILRGSSDANTVTVPVPASTNAKVKLSTAGAMVLGASDTISFLWDGSFWVETARSNNTA